MNCPACGEYHNSFSVQQEFQFNIKANLKDKRHLSYCKYCDTILKTTTSTNKRIAIFTAFGAITIGLYLGLSFLLNDLFSETASLVFNFSFIALFFYGMQTVPNWFTAYKTAEDQSLTVIQQTVKRGLWIPLVSYLIVATALTAILFNIVDPGKYEGLWAPVLFVLYFSLLLYIAGLILIKYTEKRQVSGTES